MKKAAIESASIEMLELFGLASAEARIEKKGVPPISKTVYYWTRKPLVLGRAVALACTLENPKDVEGLLGLSRDTRAYKSTPNRTRYRDLLGTDPLNIAVLDPFAGTGNLAFPAAELGLSVTCSDYNPLAHLIERGSLEIPIVSDSNLADEFERVANEIMDEVESETRRFYNPRNLAYLWAWCIRCTHCGQRVPLLNQMYLATKKKIGMRFIATRDKDFTVELDRDITESCGKSFTHKRGKAACISCGNSIKYADMTRDIAKNKDKEMIAIQVQKPGKQGRDYALPSTDDRKQYRNALRLFELNRGEYSRHIPTETVYKDPRNPLRNYGVNRWDEFFNGRQLLVLSTVIRKIDSRCAELSGSHAPMLRVYLSFLVARLVDSYSYGATWNSSGEEPENTLALRQPRIVFNLAEINPFVKVRGSLQNSVSNIAKAIRFCARLKNPVTCRMESVTVPSDRRYDLIITDPPYGDDVLYGEFSEFLYLWMRGILKDETLPVRAPLDEDFCVSNGRFGDGKLASEFFERGLRKSMVAINGKLKDDGLLAVFFAHSSIRAWNQLLLSLRAGGFRVVSSYALHTENPDNPLARGKASFMSSIVVACRKITGDSSGFIEDVIPDTEDRIRETIYGIPDDRLLELPITDLLIMVYGRVLESCTKHRTLKSRSGGNKPDFERLLADAQSAVMRILVSRLTKSNMNVVGPRMAFYVLVKVFQGGRVTADEMHKITKSYYIEPSALERSGVVARSGGAYKLERIHENEMDYPPENVERDNLHQQLCYLARRVHEGKAGTVDRILDGENFRRSTLKQIVHLILQSFDMRKNRGKGLDGGDREEMEILQTLADTMGVRMEGGLDAFAFK